MANDDPDGLELHPHMLHDLMQNQAGVNSVWVEETNCKVCFGGLFWQTRKKSGEIPGVFGSPGDGIHPTLYPILGEEECALPEAVWLCSAWRHLLRTQI